MVNLSCHQMQTVRADRIEAAIIARFVEEAESLNRFANEPDRPEICPPSVELTKLRDQLSGLQALGQNPIIAVAIEELKIQVNRLSYTETNEAAKQSQIKNDFLALFSEKEFWDFALTETEGKTQLFNQFVDRVTIKDGAVIEVRLKL